MFILMIFFNLLSLNTSDPTYLWLIMETNFMVFIFFMILLNESPSSIIQYFFIQSIPSMFLIWSIHYSSLNNLNISNNIFIISMLLKLGLFPFNFWPQFIFKNMSMFSIISFSSLQKFIPLVMFTNFLIKNEMNLFFILMIMLSIFLSSIQGMSSNNINMIMVNSSINMTSWMMMLSLTNFFMFKNFFLLYSIILILILLPIHYLLMDLNSIYSMNNSSFLLFFNYLFFLMSMIPPFSSFIIKTNAIFSLIFSKLQFASVFLMLLAIFSIFMYINFLFKILFLSKMKNKISTKMKIKNMLLIIISISLSIATFFMFIHFMN